MARKMEGIVILEDREGRKDGRMECKNIGRKNGERWRK